MKNNAKYLYLLSLLILPFNVFSSDNALILESDWLKFEEGSKGQALGATVENIEPQGGDGVIILELSLPLNNPTDFDSIEVLSRNTGEPIEQKKPPVWIEDYENGKYGLRLFLIKKPAVEFRLRLVDEQRD